MRDLRQKGFTLIELLVVVAIIGILAAIAIPQYAAYKKAAVDSKMKSDLHNAATAMEAYYGSNGNTYAGVVYTTLVTYGYRQSSSITLTPTGAADTYVLTAATTGGNHPAFSFSSTTGQIVANN